MQQNIGPLGHGDNRRCFDRVPGNNHRAALVIKAITDRRFYRCVVDTKGRDFQALVVEYDHRISLANRGQRKGKRFATAAARGKDFFTVVGDAVSKIQNIGRTKTVHDFFYASGAIDGERRGRCSQPPVLEHDGTEAINVVRVKVRQEKRLNLATGNAHIA